jgi:hypothetical protein
MCIAAMRPMRPTMSRKIDRKSGSEGTTNIENISAGTRQPHWMISVRRQASPMPLRPRTYLMIGRTW